MPSGCHANVTGPAPCRCPRTEKSFFMSADAALRDLGRSCFQDPRRIVPVYPQNRLAPSSPRKNQFTSRALPLFGLPPWRSRLAGLVSHGASAAPRPRQGTLEPTAAVQNLCVHIASAVGTDCRRRSIHAVHQDTSSGRNPLRRPKIEYCFSKVVTDRESLAHKNLSSGATQSDFDRPAKRNLRS